MNVSREILQQFCGVSRAGTAKFTMDAPFVRDNWVYATDGRICIRQPRGLMAFAGVAPPPVEALFADFPGTADISLWFPFDDPAVDKVQTASHWCPACDGTNREPEQPDKDFPYGEDEAGDCTLCGGTSRILDLAWFVLDERCFLASDVRMIRKYLPRPTYTFASKQTAPLKFRFGKDGEGVLLPIEVPIKVSLRGGT